jgi:hypothetical protein
MIINKKQQNKQKTVISPLVQIKNLKTDKQKIDFLIDKMKSYFVAFKKGEGGNIEKDKWGRWSFVNFPTFENFFVLNEIRKKEFDYLVKISPDLQDEVSRANIIIKDIIVKGGLSGGFNPKFTQFAAQNLIGWSSKTEIKGGGADNRTVIQIVTDSREKRGLPAIKSIKKLTKSIKLTKLTKKSPIIYNKERGLPSDEGSGEGDSKI